MFYHIQHIISTDVMFSITMGILTGAAMIYSSKYNEDETSQNLDE